MARETWTFAQLIAAGWSESDLEWERQAEECLSALAEGRLDEARAGFAGALRLARAEFAANDPRLAASLSNQAAAVTAADGGGAGQIKAAAQQAWSACDSWIEKMTAPRTARSSMFHLRMERLHRPAYEERWRVKGRELLADIREDVCVDGQFELVGRDEAAERLARWHRERPVTLSDPRKLMAAVILVAAREKRVGDTGSDALPSEEGVLQQR